MAAVSSIIAGAGAAAALGGTVIAAKGLSAQKKAANAAANARPATVDIPGLQTQAQQIALENAANSAALEELYNPGASQLRAGGLAALNAQLGANNPELDALVARIAAQAGTMPEGIRYNSPLLQAAIDRAAADLSLGGELPQDVRNLVARQALARSGTVTGNLGLGRDITARDLGLTSLQLAQQRLQNATTLGQAQSSEGLANAGFDLQSQLAGTNNLFNSANFLSTIDSGNFAKALAAAQLGQNIAQPASGLDPGSVANLAVGNTNAINQQQQQALALQSGVGGAQAQLGSSLLGAGLGIAGNFYRPTTTTPAVNTPVYTSPVIQTSPSSYSAGGYTAPASYTSFLPSTMGGF